MSATTTTWYPTKTLRIVGTSLVLGDRDVTVIASRKRDIGSEWGSRGEYGEAGEIQVRDATPEEMRVMRASQAAAKAGHGKDHPDRLAYLAQIRRNAA